MMRIGLRTRLHTRLADADELLDTADHDQAELMESLDQVAEVNRLLGGTRAVLRTLDGLMNGPHAWSILDIGTASADIPIAIDAWACKRGLDVDITATDLHAQMRQIATERTRPYPRIRVEHANALDLQYEANSFDFVLLSLTLHHFEQADQVRAVREAARVARQAVIVNELERCLPNYMGARLLALTRWRGNRLTRHDGPLSVLRAFTRPELNSIASTAHVHVRSVRRHFFHRLVMVLDPATD